MDRSIPATRTTLSNACNCTSKHLHVLIHLPVKLSWIQEFPTRADALEAERQIKGWSRAKKEAFIARDWERVQALATVRSPDRRTDPSHPTSASG